MSELLIVNIPYHTHKHGTCPVHVDPKWWYDNDNANKQWRVLGIPNERKTGNYVIYGNPQLCPVYMHVSTYLFHHPDDAPHVANRHMQIDHFPCHDPTDNRIESLRLVTRASNLAGRRPPKRKRESSSAYKGVCRKSKDKWVVEYFSKRHMTKRMRTACVATETDAALLYNRIVKHFDPTYGYQNDVGVSTASANVETLFEALMNKHQKNGWLLVQTQK